MAPGQANVGPRPAPQPGQRKIFKPDDMDDLPVPEADKVRYKAGLRSLWNILQTSQRGSQQQLEAQKKIAEFSAQLMNKLRGAAAAGRPVSQASQGQQGQPSAQAGGDQNIGASAGSPPAPAASGQPAQAPVAAAGGANQPGQPQQQGARPGGWSIHPTLQNHLDQMVYLAPQDVVDQGPEAVAQWTKEKKDKYQRAIIQMSQAAAKSKEFEPIINQLRQKGPAITPDETKKLQEAMTNRTKMLNIHTQVKTWTDTFRKEQAAIKEARAQANGGAAPDAATNQPARPGPSPQQPANIAQQGSAAEAAKAQQPGVAGRMPGANGQAGQQQPQNQSQPPQATSSAPPQASLGSAPQAGPSAASQQQIKIEPGTQSHPGPPPSVNTAIAAAAAGGMPSGGTPIQNAGRISTPQTATPNTGLPRSLSHTAALQMANQTRTTQPGMPGSQGTPQGPGGTPSSAGVMGTAQQPGHSHAHPTQQPQTTLTQKLPIPKHLPEKAAQPPQPVPTNLGGVTPGRPTYTQGGGTPGGVMGQAVLPKIPVVQMEGEGERALTRKKLDDLVRQVCGGQAEGQEGNALTPDVEEVRYSHLEDTFEQSLSTLGDCVVYSPLTHIYPLHSPSSASPMPLSTVFSTQPAPTPSSAGPRCSRSATSNSCSSASTTSASPVTHLTSCARSVKCSLHRAGLPR